MASLTLPASHENPVLLQFVVLDKSPSYMHTGEITPRCVCVCAFVCDCVWVIERKTEHACLWILSSVCMCLLDLSCIDCCRKWNLMFHSASWAGWLHHQQRKQWEVVVGGWYGGGHGREQARDNMKSQEREKQRDITTLSLSLGRDSTLPSVSASSQNKPRLYSRENEAPSTLCSVSDLGSLTTMYPESA